MPDIRSHLKSLKAPTPDYVVKWVRNEPISLTYYRMLGAEPYFLTAEEIRDKEKREAKVGKFFVGPDGLLTFGDLVAYIMPKVDADRIQMEATQLANKRLDSLAKGGFMADERDPVSGEPVMTHARFTSVKNSNHPLMDSSGDAAEAAHKAKQKQN